jgi:phage baseplate assembly protein W
MADRQKYGIKYPFTSDNDDGIFLDLNKTFADGVKSRVLHVIFTPKGQKLRDPHFGTDLIKFIFNQDDNLTLDGIKTEITGQIMNYVPEVEFKDLRIYQSENDEHGIIVSIEYGVKNGNKMEITTVSVKL